MYICPFELQAMDLNVPVTHTKIHCKLNSCKTKVYLTPRPIRIRIENSYFGVLEAGSNSGSMVHAIFLTINSVFFLFFVSCFVLIRLEKEPRDFSDKILLLGGNHDGSKYHRSITYNHGISKLIIPAFASTSLF